MKSPKRAIRFPISLREAKALFKQLRRAWRYEELVPQHEGYILIPTRRIEVPKNAIRIGLGNLEGLKGSIEREGVLQPICVRPLDAEWRRFEPVIGLRRFLAARGLVDKIPAYIREVEDEHIASLALEENRFRKDLTQPELLRAMLALRDRGFSVERIAERAGMNPSEVSVYLRIPGLPNAVRRAFESEEISLEHVKALMKVGKGQMLELLERIRREGLSAKDAQLLASMRLGKLELPGFFDKREFLGLLGKNLEFRRGKRSLVLKVSASSEREMGQILKRVLRMEKA